MLASSDYLIFFFSKEFAGLEELRKCVADAVQIIYKGVAGVNTQSEESHTIFLLSRRSNVKLGVNVV